METLKRLAPHAHWLLRIALASVFLYHGLDKFLDLAGAAEMMESMPMAVLVAVLETGGALLILAGGVSKDWMTRVGGLLIVPVMLGAIFMVHWGQWSFMPSETHPVGGIEFQFTLLMIALYFAVVGNGIQKETVAPAA